MRGWTGREHCGVAREKERERHRLFFSFCAIVCVSKELVGPWPNYTTLALRGAKPSPPLESIGIQACPDLESIGESRPV
jgi:hypothetical protein